MSSSRIPSSTNNPSSTPTSSSLSMNNSSNTNILKPSFSGSSHLFSLASQPDIIRSYQKDNYILSLFKDDIVDVINLLGLRSNNYIHEIELITNFIYYQFTTGRSKYTLGEEYCDIQLINYNGNLSNRITRFKFILLNTILPYIYYKILKARRLHVSDENENKKRVIIIYNYIITLTNYISKIIPDINKIHLALFYLYGVYFTIPNRLTGLQYIYTRKLTEPRPHYSILGLLLFIQIIFTYILALKQEWPNIKRYLKNETISKADESSNDNDESSNDGPTCTLCLSSRRNPTVTECGHVFCWDCISEWVAKKPECPLCRSVNSLNKLLLLSNYQ